jgi:phage baseplate assembly protein W
MKQGFYTLPLQLNLVMEGKDLPMCSLEESIHQHIHLILTTSFGEIEYDGGFGCIVWEADFDNLTAVNKMRDQIKNSVLSVLQQYETRIEKIKIEIFIAQEELKTLIKGKRVKKRIDIQVTGVLKATRMPYTFIDRFFVGPLSYQ